MLIQFSFKNFLSFENEVIFDMTAVKSYKEHPYNLITNTGSERILRVAAIYGANASGKSNFFLAFDHFREIVLHSMDAPNQDFAPTIQQCFVPFAFKDGENNSEFQIIFTDDTAEYKYGFEYNNETIVSEWLYKTSFDTHRTSTIIERTVDDISIGLSVKKECEKYKDQIPPETLALTFFNRLILTTDIFNNVYDSISNMTVLDPSFTDSAKAIENFLPSVIDKNKPLLVDFLKAIDTGIRDIRYDNTNGQIRFFTYHKGSNNKEYALPLFHESQGTIKSIVIFIFASEIIRNNGLLVVDELNTKLHPLLLKFLVDLFYNEKSTAQLVYTTHDTTLLDKKFFRRDQIWFVEKDIDGYSKLTALSDFRIRSDASFEKDYLSGVYGGIPMLKEFSMEEGE